MELRIQVTRTPEGEGLPLPSYGRPGDAGMDLHAAVEGEVTLQPGERALISSGLRIAIPPGFEAQIRPRSGLALRHGISMVNSPGTVDAAYRGVIGLILINASPPEHNRHQATEDRRTSANPSRRPRTHCRWL